MERYEAIKDVFDVGMPRLLIDKKTNESFVVTYIERGDKVDAHVQRKIIIHRSLRHPNIIKFKEVYLTPTHLVIVKEYAAGGELYHRLRNAGRFDENEARSCFQQLISAVSYCHSMEICHWELNSEYTQLDDSPTPCIKIRDFSYSKYQSEMVETRGKRAMSKPAYIAPEVLLHKDYDEKIADVWSCGMTLYAMLVGAYPFEDPEEPQNFRKTITNILGAKYSIPEYACVSADCKNLLSLIFVADPSKRITITEIKKHPWFLVNYPEDLSEGEKTNYGDKDGDEFVQSEEEIMQVIEEAKTLREVTKAEQNAGYEC